MLILNWLFETLPSSLFWRWKYYPLIIFTATPYAAALWREGLRVAEISARRKISRMSFADRWSVPWIGVSLSWFDQRTVLQDFLLSTGALPSELAGAAQWRVAPCGLLSRQIERVRGGSNISGHDRGRTFRCPNWSVTLLYFVVICLLGLEEAGFVADVRCARLGIHIIHICLPVRNDGEHSLVCCRWL